MSDLGFPLTANGSDLSLDERLCEGVLGYAVQADDGAIWIPTITAEKEGDGRVDAFLDRLPRDRAVVFPTVMSTRLRGMLQRRGFEHAIREECDVWQRLVLSPADAGEG